ncbi:hypothetical protein RhiJN_22813 [Ceratobasidium sp. AG-Ba]|nr:hypothetical protein RhiJN_22813 [Ceratobasidium sp. AG-Ba]
MPAAKILYPIKDVFKRDKSDDEHDRPQTKLYDPPVARDYATAPMESGSDSDLSIVAHPQSDAPESQKVTAPEDYPLLPSDATTSQTSVNLLDAQAELASTKIAQKTESEEDEEEDALSDKQLRRLYEDEEVERFLTVFATHVNEITLAATQGHKPKKVRIVRSNSEGGSPSGIKLVPVEDEEVDSDAETDIDEPWTYLNPNEAPEASKAPTTVPVPEKPSKPAYKPPRYLSARVAEFLVSKLPPAPVAPPAKFRLGAARLAGQRMYFSTYPFYAPFIANLMSLAAWSNWHHSARVCAVWWVLWWFNMLLPALCGRILFALLRRGIMRNPTLQELRKRRRIAEEADDLGDALEGHGAAASFLGTGPVPGAGQGGGDMGFRDIFKLAKIITKGKGKKAKEKAKETSNAVASQVGIDVEEDDNESQKADWRSSTLKAMEDFADFHERVRNLFIWRREQSSRVYALVFTILTLFFALTPAHILAKLTYAAIGFLYWFGVPVILAMPAEAFKRLPPPLADVPSDAEYAISLISARVAQGESIIPVSRRTRRQHGRARRYVANLNPSADGPGDITRDRGAWAAESGHKQSLEDMRKEANEKEAIAEEERAAASGEEKTVTSEQIGAQEDVKPNPGPVDRLKHQWEEVKSDLTSKNKELDDSVHTIGAPQTVPANHKATPGSLTLNSEAITFTPLLKSTPRRVIPLEQIQGVKKTHHTSGLRIRYKDDQKEQHEVVLRFIPNRDEIFGKLVGWGGKRWRKV